MNERIHELRRALKLSQVEFGKRIGISGQAVSKIENGVNTPADRTIQLICSTFRVSFEWLTTGAGEMFAAPPDGEREAVEMLLTVMRQMPDNVWRDFRESVIALLDAAASAHSTD